MSGEVGRAGALRAHARAVKVGGQRRRSLRIPSGLAADTIRKEASENNDEAGQANSDSLSSNRLIGGDDINAWPNVEKAGRLTGSGFTRRRGDSRATLPCVHKTRGRRMAMRQTAAELGGGLHRTCLGPRVGRALTTSFSASIVRAQSCEGQWVLPPAGCPARGLTLYQHPLAP